MKIETGLETGCLHNSERVCLLDQMSRVFLSKILLYVVNRGKLVMFETVFEIGLSPFSQAIGCYGGQATN